ncbi:MAG: DUF177 domain-containing protein [Rhodospirillaceae bacterium]
MSVDRGLQPEFSRVIRLESIPADKMVREIEATPAECRALAARFSLESIDGLSATVRLCRQDGGRMIRVRGRLAAKIVQTCVVSLASVPASVTESFTALYAPEALLPAPDEEIVIDPFSDDDVPELLPEEGIDIGELTAQHLSLALDPYPRCPGVEFPGVEFPGVDDDRDAEESKVSGNNPFGVLVAFKPKT